MNKKLIFLLAGFIVCSSTAIYFFNHESPVPENAKTEIPLRKPFTVLFTTGSIILAGMIIRNRLKS